MYCPPVVLIFPGFEKLPVVAFTFGVFAASHVQDVRFKIVFLFICPKYGLRLCIVFGPSKMVAVEFKTFEHSC